VKPRERFAAAGSRAAATRIIPRFVGAVGRGAKHVRVPDGSNDARPAAGDGADSAALAIQAPVADELACPEQTPPTVPAPLHALPSGPIGWQVLMLALPMLGEQFFHFLVGFVDTWLAGHVSKEATAAVGTGAYMGWFITLIGSLVGTGAAALVSRSFGARDRALADRVANQSLILAVALGAAMSAAVYAAAPLLSGFLSQTPEACDLLLTFLRIDALGYTLYSVVLVCGGVMRAAGDTRTPMRIMALVNLLNIALSAGLVFGWYGPKLGTVGIAIGTVIARSLGGILLAATLVRGLRGMHIRPAALRPDVETIGRILRIGVPAGADALLMWLAQLAFIKVISETAAGDAGTANYAAHMIAMRMEAISYLPAVAWMTAAATLVGQYLGAGRARDAARSGHVAALQGAALTACVGAAFYLLAGPIFGLMSHDPTVHAVGVPAFRLLAFVQPLLCMAIVYTGALRGAGDTRATLVISLIAGLLLRVPVAYLGGVVLGGGLIGAWCGMWSDNVAKFAMGLGRFAHGGWKRVRV
jgi:putative MATE family efflux protein